MAYEVVMSYHLHMPSYFLGTFTEYPSLKSFSGNVSVNRGSVADNPPFLILMFVVLRITFNIINL